MVVVNEGGISSAILSYFDVDNSSEKEILGWNWSNGIFGSKGRIFRLFGNKINHFFCGIIALAKRNKGRREVLDSQLLQGQFIAVKLDVNFCTIDFSALKTEENVVGESETERLGCCTNQGSFAESGIGGAKRVENKSEVGVCAKVIVS